ncbi:MAG TPA: threonylcarbamoyl-AMP synthase [Eubacteriaceae bacterium]|nr:threonylcarbamoyl-AMP synthase [Eubacteriaceae bacterium]
MTRNIRINRKNLGSKEAKIALQQAAVCLKQGGTVVFPTETVYGLGADGLKKDSVKKIYQAKGRPSDNPIILHIGKKEKVDQLAKNISQTAKKLMDSFWPGPLTLIFEKSDLVPDEVTGGLKTVALRMPSHPVAQALLSYSGLAVAAPSANRSGRPSPTKGIHSQEDLQGRVDLIIHSDPSDIGLESTVVDVTKDRPVILRPGKITKEELESALGIAVQTNRKINQKLTDQEQAASPGMKYKHYAPRGEMFLVTGEKQRVLIEAINRVVRFEKKKKNTVVLAVEEDLSFFDGHQTICFGSEKNLDTVMHELYNSLRKCDRMGAEKIVVPLAFDLSRESVLYNRLLKAANHQTIKA